MASRPNGNDFEEEEEEDYGYGDDRDDGVDGGRGESSQPASKRGRGKGKAKAKQTEKAEPPLSKAAAQLRRDQNRVAQREFRQRKQQHIRDLEAQVQILSGDRDERQDLMSLLVRNLLKENAQLRKMVKDLSGFIGEGLATCLPRLGMTIDSMDAFVNRAESETAHEAYAALKAVRDKELAEGASRGDAGAARLPSDSALAGRASNGRSKSAVGVAPGERAIEEMSMASMSPQDSTSGFARKRRAMSPAVENGQKRARRLDDHESNGHERPYSTGISQSSESGRQSRSYPATDGFPHDQRSRFGTERESIGSIDPALDAPTYRPNSIPPNLAALVDAASYSSISYGTNYDTVPRGSAAPIDFAASAASSSNDQRDTPGPSHTSLRDQSPRRPSSTSGTGTGTYMVSAHGQQAPMMQAALENAPQRFQQACQLVAYHLKNYQTNPNYHLPPPLRPTDVQRTIPHEHLIDGLIFPELRDRMIMMRGRYDIMKAFQQIFTEWTVPGEDILDQNSWEVSERWFKDNPLLMVSEVIAIANRWRISRGEEPMTRESLTAVGAAGEA